MQPADSLVLGADVLCFSHLRWSFVFQRPQHLMSRYARDQRVIYIEEHETTDADTPSWSRAMHDGVMVAVPQLPRALPASAITAALRQLADDLIRQEQLARYVTWYYTPAALPFTDHLHPVAVVYDCMDELAAFKGADAALPVLETRLMARADVMFTGGYSLYEAKCGRHENVHVLPSSVDTRHFAAARYITDVPADQRAIPTPRLGFFGVLDERLDTELLSGLAAARPQYHFVMIGPVVKIDPRDLPTAPNIHYLGPKTYQELPAYIAGWDVALLLFALNDATRFISPTKTPEYLAAGKPVVSTPIRDVVRTYGERGLVRLAYDVESFAGCCDAALSEPPEPRRQEADVFLRSMSWEQTFARTVTLIHEAIARATQHSAAARRPILEARHV